MYTSCSVWLEQNLWGMCGAVSGDARQNAFVCFKTNLIDFVVDLIEYPGLVIVDRIIFNGGIHQIRPQPIHDFDLVKRDHGPTRGPARDAGNGISLDRDLNLSRKGRQDEHDVLGYSELTPQPQQRANTVPQKRSL